MNDRLHPSQLPAGLAASAVNLDFSLGEARTRWAVNVAPWSHSSRLPGTALAAARWWEPNDGTEFAVLVTDDWRDEAGEDGGRGRAFAVRPGGDPIQIPLNGHDVWGPCRLVPGRTALLLLRHGNARWYVTGTDGSDEIETNVAHGLADGNRVRVVGDVIPSPMLNDSYYWVEVVDATTVTLHSNQSLTGAITISDSEAASKPFALELATVSHAPGGTGAMPLVLENGWAGEFPLPAWQVGFVGVPTNVACSVDHEGSVWTAPNHRFAAGQGVNLGAAWDVDLPTPGTIATSTKLYVRPLNLHTFTLHTTAEDALLGTNAMEDATAVAGGLDTTVTPNGYSGQPIVPLREAILFQNRTVGINQANNVAISDPGDFLHFTPFTNALTLYMGNGDPLTALIPLSEDALLFMSTSQVLSVTGLSAGDPALKEVTRAYGCIAQLSAVQVGRDVWFLSRDGVVSIAQTDFGLNQGVARPASEAITRKIAEIDFRHASMACAAWFNNKYLLAVPLKGQEKENIQNNCILVYNLLTQQWDGYWQGDGLRPVQFFRLTLGLEERLCWLDADGSVKWFTEGWEDITLDYDADTEDWTYGSVAIETELLTRAYTGGNPRKKHWQEAELVFDTINPSYGVAAVTEGYNEVTAYRTAQTRDPSKWLTWNTADFDPATEPDRANLPYREDYSAFTSDYEMVPAGTTYRFPFGPLSSYVDVSGFIVGQPYTVTLNGGSAVQWVATGTNITSDGEYTAEGPIARIFILGNYIGQPVVTSIKETDAIDLGDSGVPFDAHQTTHTNLPLRERCRSLQLKLTNAQGSTRWRAATVAGKLERGDW